MPHDLLHITPVRGNVGVVRMLMLLPQSHLLFIGPAACARHDVLPSMIQYRQRISHLCLDEEDIISGDYEELIIDAVEQILNGSTFHPKAMLMYSGCQDSLIGTDYAPLLDYLENEYGIPFGHFAMNRMPSPGRPPLMSILHKTIYDFISVQEEHDDAINLLSNMPSFAPENELFQLLAGIGIKTIHYIKKFDRFADFQAMGRARCNLALTAPNMLAAQSMQERMQIPWAFTPISYSTEEIAAQYEMISGLLGCTWDLSPYQAKLEQEIAQTRALLGETPLSLDSVGISRPYDLAKALIQSGFQLKVLYAVPAPAYDQDSLSWLQTYAPTLEICPPLPRSHSMFVQNWDSFVPGLEGSYFGFAAVSHILDVLRDAFLARRLISSNVQGFPEGRSIS